MPWFKVDDSFSDHPKVRRIPRKQRAAAIGLWTLAGSWSMKHLTEGAIPAYMVEEFGCSAKESASLVAVGLWEVSDDGWQFHDWNDMQPTKEKVEDDRAAAAERQRRAREKAKQKREQENSARDELREPPPDDDEVTRESRRDESVSHGSVTSPRPDPTRPVLLPAEEETSSSEAQAPPTPRPEVDTLCTLLADLVEGNGSKRPTVTKTWRDAARLMLDRDGREPAKATELIRWVQADEFWRSNVMSMPKFREKYDELRLKATADWEAKRNGNVRPLRTSPALDAASRALNPQLYVEGR